MNRLGDSSLTIREEQMPMTCCKGNCQSDKMLKILDHVCRAALAVFAVLVNPVLFAYSLAVGSIAAAMYVLSTRGGDQNSGVLKPVCGQGYMEFLSGKTFPRWTVHVVTTAFIAAHVRHDPLFFVPFCGLFIGWWVGSGVSTTAWTLAQRMMHCPARI